MIELNATCEKSDIPFLGTQKGLVNATHVTIYGQVYSAHTLRFLGFVGSLRPDSKYHGCLRFEDGVFEDAEIGDFFEIMGHCDKPDRDESEADDGV